MATIPKKVRVKANPHRANRPAHSSRPTNAAPRKGSTMANKKKAAKMNHNKKNAAHNPHRRNKRRNPEMFGASGSDLLVSSVAGLANAVLTKQLPQLVFSTGNTGIEGYGMNLVTALAGAWAAGKFAGPKAGMGAMVGGMVILLDRILTEQFSTIGPYLTLSGVGDPTAATHNMGTVRDGYYLHPTNVDGHGNMIVPDPVTQAALAAVLAKYPQLAAPVAQAVATPGNGSMHAVAPSALRKHVASGQLLSSRFQGRFNQSLN
jgi:hypothetical protein